MEKKYMSKDEMKKIYVIIKKLIKDNITDYQILYHLVHDYNYDLDTLVSAVESFKHYVNMEIIVQNNTINTLIFITNIYYNLLHNFKGLKNLIENSYKDTDIAISYYLFYVNDLVPSKIDYKLGIFLSPNDPLYKKYLAGYTRYYKSKKDKIKKESENEKVKKFEIIIKDFIDSDYITKKEYCMENDITINEFRYMVSLLKKHNSPVYDLYANFIEEKTSQRYAIIRGKVEKLLNSIVNAKGKFTLLDYYENTNYTIGEIIKITKGKMTKEQERYFAVFCKKYQKEKFLVQEGIDDLLYNYKISYTVNDNTMYDVTKEDKEQAIIMLKERHIPITSSTFNLMLRKYFDENILPQYIGTQNTKKQ